MTRPARRHARAPRGQATVALTPDQYRIAQARDMREDPALTSQVVRTARGCGWLVTHFRPARTASGDYRTALQGDPGFPDIIAVHRVVPVTLLAELKRYRTGGSAAERPNAQQRAWLDAFARTGAYATCWTTLDWIDGVIQRALADPRAMLAATIPPAPRPFPTLLPEGE